VAWGHLREDAPVYAREWSDVAMAGRLAELYRQLSAEKMPVPGPLTVAA
jgi:hypothetical protein